MVKDTTRLGIFIATCLNSQRKNQKWLSEQCGVRQAHISRVLSGKSHGSRLLMLRIAKAIQVDPDLLLCLWVMEKEKKAAPTPDKKGEFTESLKPLEQV